MADDPAQPIELKGFHARILKDAASGKPRQGAVTSLPEVRPVDDATIAANYQQVFKDVRDICDGIMQMLLNDPDKRHLIVKKSAD